MTDQRIVPLVSVIVPCYNHGRFLRETLNSVLNQTWSNWECIMVDNDSTDNTRDIANGFVKSDPRFSYHHQQNKGVSSARNIAISKSKGKYILPLDSDDKIGREYLEKAVDVMETDRDVSIVYCEAELFGNSSGRWNLPAFEISTMLMENLIFCSALYRREDYDKTGGYDESMVVGFEDWDFWLSMLEKNSKVYRLPDVHFFYRIRSTSRNHSIDLEKQKELRRYIFEKHKKFYLDHIDIPEMLFEVYRDKLLSKQISQSKEYRIGKWIKRPFIFFKNLFK